MDLIGSGLIITHTCTFQKIRSAGAADELVTYIVE